MLVWWMGACRPDANSKLNHAGTIVCGYLVHMSWRIVVVQNFNRKPLPQGHLKHCTSFGCCSVSMWISGSKIKNQSDRASIGTKLV